MNRSDRIIVFLHDVEISKRCQRVFSHLNIEWFRVLHESQQTPSPVNVTIFRMIISATLSLLYVNPHKSANFKVDSTYESITF